MSPRSLGLILASAIVAADAGCGCVPHFRDCAEVSPEQLDALPLTLAETGLFADATMQSVASEVRTYEPRFPLWSDGRRWARPRSVVRRGVAQRRGPRVFRTRRPEHRRGARLSACQL